MMEPGYLVLEKGQAKIYLKSNELMSLKAFS